MAPFNYPYPPPGYYFRCRSRWGCNNTQYFPTYGEWAIHVQTAHGKKWICSCHKTFRTHQAYCAHIMGSEHSGMDSTDLAIYKKDGKRIEYVHRGKVCFNGRYDKPEDVGTGEGAPTAAQGDLCEREDTSNKTMLEKLDLNITKANDQTVEKAGSVFNGDEIDIASSIAFSELGDMAAKESEGVSLCGKLPTIIENILASHTRAGGRAYSNIFHGPRDESDQEDFDLPINKRGIKFVTDDIEIATLRIALERAELEQKKVQIEADLKKLEVRELELALREKLGGTTE